MKKPPSVFEKYAHEYDLITNAAQREAYHAKEVAAIISRLRPTRVLDAGCATGLTAMLFARQGVEAVGLDRSRAMLREADNKYGRFNLPLSFTYGNFEKLPKRMDGTFDLVVCLANAVAGVGSMANLRLAMKRFHDILSPGGALVLQLLNYQAIKEETLFPIKATENDGIVYQRFSERRGRRLSVYVTRADFRRTPPQFEIFRSQFDNFTAEQVQRSIDRAGFVSQVRYRDLYLARRFTKSSRDLIVLARRAEATF